MAINKYCILFLALYVSLSQCASNKVCLYNGETVLNPLKLYHKDCPTNNENCMLSLYKYGSPIQWQYNGPATLKPRPGEIAMFLTQDEEGRLDFVTFLNAVQTTTVGVKVTIEGALPAPIILYDDPVVDGDYWTWNPNTNTGNFSWTTQPGKTDGVIIGHLNFSNNYCVRTAYTPINNALSNVSIFTGNVTNPVRIVSLPFTSGTTFQFCSYPVIAATPTNVTCPGGMNGGASASIVVGPPDASFTWRDSAGNIVGNSATLSNVRAGTYSINVDSTGCTADNVIQISQPAPMQVTLSTTPFTCALNGTASVVIKGSVGPFVFQWKKGATVISTSSSVGGLAVGQYSVCVTDSCSNSTCYPFNIGSTGCCGDSICNASLGENCLTCQSDCPRPCGMCGDGTCSGAETCSSCTQDCGSCCRSGTFQDGLVCTPCPPGSFSIPDNSPSCTQCPANTFSNGGNTSCQPCPANMYSAAGSGKCMRCPVGQSRAVGQSACTMCPAGTQSQLCDDAICMPCGPGTYSAMGSFACLTCAPGSAQPLSGQSACNPCGPGTYAMAGSSTCASCPGGKTSAAGSTHIVACM